MKSLAPGGSCFPRSLILIEVQNSRWVIRRFITNCCENAMRHFYLFAVFIFIRNHKTESSHPDRFGRMPFFEGGRIRQGVPCSRELSW